MMTAEAAKCSLEELKHYGVKGMRWGVRNGEASHPAYTKQMQEADRRSYGDRAVARINKRMHEGETRKQALEREDVRDSRQRLAAVGAVYAALVLAKYGSGPIAATKVANPSNAVGSTATPLKYITPNRHGVHKITTMK